MKSSSFFSGALSKANTAITQAKNDPKYNGNTPVEVLEEKAAHAIYPELLNIETDLLFSSFVKCGLALKSTDNEIPVSIYQNILMLSCELIVKDALSLYKIEPSKSTYNTVRIVWASDDFKPSKQKKVKQQNKDYVGSQYKTAEELEAEFSGEGDCAGGACKI